MEVVKIPRFTLWNEESVVFEQIYRFARLSSKLCTNGNETEGLPPAIFVLRKISETAKLEVEELQILFHLLQEVAFHYRQPAKGIHCPRWCPEPMITDEMYSRWSRVKRQLKRAIKDHEGIYEQLQLKHKHCLGLEKRVNKYKNLLKITTELEDGDADSEDSGENQLTLTTIEKRLEKKLIAFDKSVQEYKTILQQEKEARAKILNFSSSLELEIRQRITEKIRLGVDFLKIVTDFDIDLDFDQVARNLHHTVSRLYVFKIPPEVSSSDFKWSIPLPLHEESDFVLPDYDVTYGYGRLGLVIAGSRREEKNYLKLNLDFSAPIGASVFKFCAHLQKSHLKVLTIAYYDPGPDPGYQWESDKLTVRHHKRDPRGQPFPSRRHSEAEVGVSRWHSGLWLEQTLKVFYEEEMMHRYVRDLSCKPNSYDHIRIKDDTVKQKLVSADGTVGFGWNRPSKFSMKRWGFYPADVLQFVK